MSFKNVLRIFGKIVLTLAAVCWFLSQDIVYLLIAAASIAGFIPSMSSLYETHLGGGYIPDPKAKKYDFFIRKDVGFSSYRYCRICGRVCHFPKIVIC